MECPRCRLESISPATFSGECRQPVAPASAARPVPSRNFDCPKTYVPKHQAQKFLAARTTLEDEGKQVTVSFADIED